MQDGAIRRRARIRRIAVLGYEGSVLPQQVLDTITGNTESENEGHPGTVIAGMQATYNRPVESRHLRKRADDRRKDQGVGQPHLARGGR